MSASASGSGNTTPRDQIPPPPGPIVEQGSKGTQKGSSDTGFTVCKVALYVLTFLCIAGAVFVAGGWAQTYLPQIVSTTMDRIMYTWAFGVAALSIGLSTLIWNVHDSCIKKQQDPIVPPKPLEA